MKDTFYFSHDYNARFDEKIKLLIRKHSMLGYGCYWSIVEDLYNNANALRTDYEGIAFDLRITIEQAKSIINDFDLFVIDGDLFGSASVERRLNERNEKSAKARESAFNRWNKQKENANAMRTQSDGNAIKEKKGKESKGKEINIPPINEFLEFSKLELKDEYQFYEFSLKAKYESWIENKWKDGNGNKITNWKSKLKNTIPYLNKMYPSKQIQEQTQVKTTSLSFATTKK
jgi:hypothetical protein